MTRTWLVSMLSDQMVPNILLARQLAANGIAIDRHLLISTRKMEDEGKSRIYCDLTGVPEQDVSVVTVDPQAVGSVIRVLEDLQLEGTDRFLVNLTGGTKMMSMGAFKWFSSRPASTFYYLPINSPTAYELEKEQWVRSKELDITVRLSVEAYLASYGVTITSQSTPDPALLQWLVQSPGALWELSRNPDAHLIQQLRHLRKATRKGKPGSLNAYPELSAWIQQHNLPLHDQTGSTIGKNEVKFLTGDWLEWLVWHQVQARFPELTSGELACGVQIQRRDARNELDIIFMRHNAPYVIECKTVLEKSFFDDTVYKLFTLRNTFGLTAKSAIVAVHLGENLKNRNDCGMQPERAQRLEALRIPFFHLAEPAPERIRDFLSGWMSNR